jgi:hypothetical protein
MNMACSEGDQLKNAVLDKIEDYLAAEQAQYTCDSFDEDSARTRAEVAHARLAESRNRYWQHIKMHHCDPAAVLVVEPAMPETVAV